MSAVFAVGGFERGAAAVAADRATREAIARFGSDRPDTPLRPRAARRRRARARLRVQGLRARARGRRRGPRAQRRRARALARRAGRPERRSSSAIGAEGGRPDPGRRRRLAGQPRQVLQRRARSPPSTPSSGPATATCCCSSPTARAVAAQALGALRLELGGALRPDRPRAPRRAVGRRVPDVRVRRGRGRAGPRCTTRSPRRPRRRAPTSSTSPTPARLLSRAYDLVVDGAELGGGSIRTHTPEMQRAGVRGDRALAAQEAQARFGFLLDALRYGAPPHGGIALGIDRIVAMIAGTRLDPRRDRLPEDRERRGPADRRPDAGRRADAARLGLRLASARARRGDAFARRRVRRRRAGRP